MAISLEAAIEALPRGFDWRERGYCRRAYMPRLAEVGPIQAAADETIAIETLDYRLSRVGRFWRITCGEHVVWSAPFLPDER